MSNFCNVKGKGRTCGSIRKRLNFLAAPSKQTTISQVADVSFDTPIPAALGLSRKRRVADKKDRVGGFIPRPAGAGLGLGNGLGRI